MDGLTPQALWTTIRRGRLIQVLAVYLGTSFLVLEAVDILTDRMSLPGWVFAGAVVLLLIGLPIILTTALIQAGPRLEHGLREIELPVEQPRAPWHAPHRWFTWKRAILGGVLAFAALGSLGLGLIWFRNSGFELQPDVVAVMPFHTVGDGLELWREGMVDLLGTALDGTGQFRSSDPRAVLNRWRKMAGDGEELPEPDIAGEVAGRLGAGQMILGSVIRTGPNDLRVAADLYSVRWLRKEGSATVQGSEDDITGMVDHLTVDLLKSVWRAEHVPEVRVSAITTSSIPALRSYLEGEQAFRRSQFDDAQNAFAQAVEADSTFSIALYRLALSYGWSIGVGPELTRYLTTAARHSRGLPERDSLLILANKLMYADEDLAAIPLFERLTLRYPDDLEAWYGLGEAYVHLGAQAGHPRTRAIEPLQHAFTLDSTFAPALIHLVEIAHAEDDSTRAREWTAEYLALNAMSRFAQAFRLVTALRFGAPADSARAAEALDTADARVLQELLCGCLAGRSTLPLSEMVALAAANPRHPVGFRGTALQTLGRQYLRHGQVTLAIDLIQQGLSLSPGADTLYHYIVTAARAVGLAVDPASTELLDRLSKRFVFPTDIPWLGILAAQEGRFDEAHAGVARQQYLADSLLASGDSLMGRTIRGLALTLRGYVAAVQDSADNAIDDLRRGLEMIRGEWSWPRDLARYWLAALVQDRGAEEEALRIYGSIWTPWLEALGYLRKAELHERRGERDQALRDYASFVELWSDADAHLQPQVESARRAMERLTAESAAS